MHKKFVLVILIIAIAGIAFYFYFSPANRINRTTTIISKVIDGDTVELANGKRVRLLGVDAPESRQYYYRASKEALKELIEGKRVELELDVSNKDSFGRLLRYIFVDDIFVNLEMVRYGYANTYIVSPDTKYTDQLIEAERQAKRAGLGIWESSPTQHSECIEITKFHYNAAGDDNKNLNDEYVVLKNNCEPINMLGWTIKDAATNVFDFPSYFILQTTVTIHSGSGDNTTSELYWGSEKSIWNNNRDTLYLRDADGNLILTQSYGR